MKEWQQMIVSAVIGFRRLYPVARRVTIVCKGVNTLTRNITPFCSLCVSFFFPEIN